MIFYYDAVKTDGSKISGMIDSLSRDAAVRELFEQQLFVKSISAIPRNKGNKVKPDDLIVFIRLLGNAVEAHIPIARALEITRESMGKSPLRSVITSILDSIKSGQDFSEVTG